MVTMGLVSFKSIARIMLLVCLWSIMAAANASATGSDGLGRDTLRLEACLDCEPAEQAEHGDESESDCDNEGCGNHRCHLWHCAFLIPRYALIVRVPLSNANQGSPYTGESSNGVRSTLLEPPCA
jgi:hypothetical protein